MTGIFYQFAFSSCPSATCPLLCVKAMPNKSPQNTGSTMSLRRDRPDTGISPSVTSSATTSPSCDRYVLSNPKFPFLIFPEDWSDLPMLLARFLLHDVVVSMWKILLCLHNLAYRITYSFCRSTLFVVHILPWIGLSGVSRVLRDSLEDILIRSHIRLMIGTHPSTCQCGLQGLRWNCWIELYYIHYLWLLSRWLCSRRSPVSVHVQPNVTNLLLTPPRRPDIGGDLLHSRLNVFAHLPIFLLGFLHGKFSTM